MELKLFNTLSRKKEIFKPIKKNKVGLYTCGPTVYNFAHIGNLRAYVSQDILVRTLKYNFGDKAVRWVMNITDVDDKTIRDSKKKYQGLEPREALTKFTKEFENIFWQDLKALNVSKPDKTPHAADTKYIKQMHDLVGRIVKAGYGYIKDGSVYFDLARYGKKYKYGQLVNLNMSKLKTGTRIDTDEYDKENIQDFVLWKGRKAGEPSWAFKLNGQDLPGRPGWHLECSAMSQAELGCPFDIHAGGEDLKFPHHEDEIAQSVVGYGKARPVNFWLHNGMLMVEGKKMSKSLGNVYNLRDFKDKMKNILSFRYLCLMTHYRKPLDFSWSSLKGAENSLEHLYNQVRDIAWFAEYKFNNHQIDKKSEEDFLKAINDDLNMPKALAVVQKVLKSSLTQKEKYSTILKFDKVLGFNLEKNLFETKLWAFKEKNKLFNVEIPGDLSDNVKKLVRDRQKAREEKKWDEADELRKRIETQGYTVEDTKDGQRISKK